MLTKNKIALAAALLVGTASTALATGFDPNLANRYPSYAEPRASAPQNVQNVSATRNTLRSAPVRLQQGRNVSTGGGPYQYQIDRNDRASSPYAGGGY